ncbi:MAG: response regulator receiver [Gemmatimonadetes bacterium]|nr:response regulator receiver [Gemmatimonadota bacterium]
MGKIMIVDDSAYARRVHRGILERAGHHVVEAFTGTGAIESFTVEKPDVVLLDLSMEDIGGVEVLRTLRQLDEEARVIVVSADVQKSTEQEVMEAGARRFLHKPASPDALVAAVSDVLGAAGS